MTRATGLPKGNPLAHDFAKQSVVCYTLYQRCRENTIAAGEAKGIFTEKNGCEFAAGKPQMTV